MKITLPWPHKDLNPNARVHHMEKARNKKIARNTASMATLGADPALCFSSYEAEHINITFNPPDRRRRDLDNMLASCKAYLDGIADALGVDDSNFKLTIQKGEPVKGGAVIVEVL